MKTKIAALLLSVSLSACFALYAEEDAKDGAAAQEDTSYPERRRKTVQALIATVTNANNELAEKDRPKVVAAIRELGRLGAPEALEVLIEKLDFHVSEFGNFGMLGGPSMHTLGEMYPAVDAFSGPLYNDPRLPGLLIEAMAAKKNTVTVNVSTPALPVVREGVSGGAGAPRLPKTDMFVSNACYLLVWTLGNWENAKVEIAKYAAAYKARAERLEAIVKK